MISSLALIQGDNKHNSFKQSLRGYEMSDFSFSNVALRAFAAATPSNVVKFDISERRVAKFVKQMGIEQVHLSTIEQTPLDLGYVALNQALSKAGWEPQELDLVIFDTQGADFLGGVGDSSLLHHYLNLREDCAVFDLTVGCSAFPYSLTVACSMLQGSVSLKRVAVLNGDLQWSIFKDPQEIQSVPQHLFGECTGAILLEKVAPETTSIINTILFADGHGYKHLFTAPTGRDSWHMNTSNFILPDGGKINHIPVNGNIFFTYMNGMAIHEFSTGKVVDCIKDHYGKFIKDYDYYVFHQANRQILNAIITRLELDSSRVLVSLDQYGNTSAASALTTICHNLHDIDHPVHIFNASFGIGLSWGFSDFVIEPGTVNTIIPTDHHFTEHCLKPVYNAPLAQADNT